MPDFWRRLFGSLAFLLTVLGAALGAQQYGAVWLVILAGTVAIAYATIPLGWARATSYLRRIVEYTSLVAERDRLRTEVDQLRAELSSAQLSRALEHERGWREGADALRGELGAWMLAEMPRLVAVSAAERGQLTFVARSEASDRPLVKTLFALRVSETNEVKGVLRVIDVAEDGTLTMVCAFRRDQRYWMDLESRPAYEVSPPQDVELAPLDGGAQYPGYRPPESA